MLTLTKSGARVLCWITLLSLGLFGQPAIAQIAPGVTQSAAHTANITGTVTQSDGTPVAGADVRLNGPAILSTRSDDHGVFNFKSVPWGTYQIVVTSSIGVASRNNVVINADSTVAIQYQAQPGLRTIAHVSTTAAGASINVTSSAITSISPGTYAFSGNSTWKQLFAQIPGVAPSGYTYGGGIFIGDTVGSPQQQVVLSINGALPYETSTTLDGMPLYGTSNAEFIEETGGGLDLSTMPLNAFDTADIVRGPGANAPSIVDSVGGSFVLHPPGQVQTNQFEFSVSNDPYGGIVSNAKVALHLGRLSMTLIYGINDSPGPGGTNLAKIPAVATTPTTINGETVWASIAGEVPNAHGIPYCYCAGSATMLYCCVPYNTGWTSHNGAVALSYDIAPSINAEVFYAGSTSQAADTGGIYPMSFQPGAGYTGSLAPSPPGEYNYELPWVLDQSPYALQASSTIEEKVTAYLGNGVLRLAAVQHNTYTGVGPGRYTWSNGNYQVWGTAETGSTSPGTPTTYNGTIEPLTFPAETIYGRLWSNNRDLLGSYDVQLGSSSSAGISYVTSYYNSPYICNVFLDGTSIYGFNQGTAVSSTTNETRLHFDTQVSDKLSLGLSWYFAEGIFHVPVPQNPDYWTNSIFPYNAPRFGAVWQATPNIAIRASAGGGFALPVLQNLQGYSLTCSSGECSEIVANLNLKPETSFGFDVGSDVRLQHNTVASLDLYRTNLFGQFFISTTISSFNGEPLYLNQYGNLASSRMEGINLDVHHDVARGYYWRGTLGFTRGYVLSVPPGFYNNQNCPTAPCANQNVIPGSNFTSITYGTTVPYASASAQLGYRWKPQTYFDLQPTYYGPNNIYLTPHPFVALNANASYAITRNIAVQAIFENITGQFDESIEHFANVSYATPVVTGTTGYWPGASIQLPFGPRAVIVTLNFKY